MTKPAGKGALPTATLAAPSPVAPAPASPARRNALLLALVTLAVVAVAAGAFALLGDDGDTPDGSSAVVADDDPGDAPQLSDLEVAEATGCSGDCEVAGSVAFVHPAWGASLFTVGSEPDAMRFAVIDQGGEVVWEEFLDRWYYLGGPEADELGHVFVEYTSGAGGTSGVIVFAPSPDGMEDFDSLPGSDLDAGAFFGQGGDGPTDVDDDGVYEILVGANDCIPSCADGSVTNTTFRWDGDAYEPE